MFISSKKGQEEKTKELKKSIILTVLFRVMTKLKFYLTQLI